jgi:thiol-disulfide isomerase/thioredoxin
MLKKSFCYILIMITGLICSCNPGHSAVKKPLKAVQLSERLQKIKMTDLKGRALTLQELAGKPVFLNFWATWCGPCISEMQSIESVYQQFKNDIVFLAVSNEDPVAIRSFMEKNKFTFEVAHLNMDYIDAYIVTMPTTLLIDASGRLIAEEEGFRDWTQYNNFEKLKVLSVTK